jgi:hypothetical protein
MKKSLFVLSLVLVMVVSGASLAFAAISPFDKILPSQNSALNSDSGKFDDGKGPRIEDNENKNLGYIKAGNYAKFSAVDFGAGASKVKAEVATPNAAGEIAFILDDPKGKPVGIIKYQPSGDWQKYVWAEAEVKGVTGTHDLYVVFTNGDVNVRAFQFVKADGAAAPAANPKTGDSGVMLYIILAIGSAAVLFAFRKQIVKQH